MSQHASAEGLHYDDRLVIFAADMVQFFGIDVVPVHIVELNLHELKVACVFFQNFTEKIRLAVNRKTKMSDTAFRHFAFKQTYYIQFFDYRPYLLIYIVQKIQVKVIRAAFIELILKDIGSILLCFAKPCRHFVSQIEAFSRMPVC